MTSARIVLDSVSPDGVRLTTLEVEMPRYLVAQLNTHRVFSRNSASSRAMPTIGVIRRAIHEPVEPAVWSANCAGMRPKEALTGIRLLAVKAVWRLGRYANVGVAYTLASLGLHKQYTNRWLEMHVTTKVLISSTEWDNFFDLRIDEAAQCDMAEVAVAIKKALAFSHPVSVAYDTWHLPYVGHVDGATPKLSLCKSIAVSVSMCAQVSYRSADVTPAKAMRVCKALLSGKKLHASPFEHVSVCERDTVRDTRAATNFHKAWTQCRVFVTSRKPFGKKRKT